MNLIVLLDYIGTFVFAISGTLTAANKRLDVFGATAIGFVTAVGGGTVRDMMLGHLPVSWIRSIDYFLIIIGGVLVTILFKKQVMKLRKTLFLFDTIGIAVFTLLGLKMALMFNVDAPMALILGLVSAVVGGVIRDTLCNEVPLIFHREIYATACLAGGLIYLMLDTFHIPEVISESVTVVTIITIRILAVRLNIALPRLQTRENE
jgi:uncharacterized membrane protein YeiH